MDRRLPFLATEEERCGVEVGEISVSVGWRWI